jgi:ATP-binding cassette subfamily B protein
MEQFQNGVSGFRRFVEIMEETPETDAPDAIALENVKGEIEFKNVSYSYDPTKEVLHNVNLKLEKGRKLALVGPSGGGKTTLCHLLPNFYKLEGEESGAILIDGIDIRDITLDSLRKNIGIVQQDVFLFVGTIKENIVYGKPDATDEEIIEAAKKANIHDYIMTLEHGYDTEIGERGVKLSGGQKQRMSIARVFLKDPAILILDEATSALDNESERLVQESLEKLAKGRTTFTIAHRLTTIRNADRILVLTEEGIMESGTHTELLQKGGMYSELYQMYSVV